MAAKKVRTVELGHRRERIELNCNQLSQRRHYQLLCIARSTAQYKPKAPSAEKLKLCRRIDEIHMIDPTFGARRMMATLKRDGIPIGRKRVSGLMKQMGIQAIYRKPRLSIPNRESKRYPYLLKDIEIERPDQVWCADITCIPMKYGHLYLVAVMDWYSRKVLSWKLSNTMDERFCVEALDEALSKAKKMPDIVNTNQINSATPWPNSRGHLKPHRVKSFKLSNDKQFQEKLEEIVGLYLNPPEHALVFSCDEKSQIQAPDRTQTGLPMKKGRLRTMTHDYKRNRTTSLFAAMNTADGNIIGTCMNKHRHQEWIRFLNLIDRSTPKGKQIHLICDNYATHKHSKVKAWLKRHRRFHFHFTPTSASWLNMVERFFRNLTVNTIREGAFQNVKDLIRTIESHITHHDKNPKPFIWTATATDILEKVKRGRENILNMQCDCRATLAQQDYFVAAGFK